MNLRSKKEKWERLRFIDFIAKYTKSSKNEVWSRQHANFISSLLKTTNQDIELFKRTHPKDFRK